MNARTHIPEHIQHRVLDRSRRRCALCVHFDNDWSQKEGQIAHLDRDPSNFAEDNLAFLCLPHHDDYDTKRRQTKNLTIPEAKTARDRLYAFIEGGGDLATAGRQDKPVTSANQSGGITAHTVRADTINLYPPHANPARAPETGALASRQHEDIARTAMMPDKGLMYIPSESSGDFREKKTQ
jgi:hypothetical protein